MIFLTAGGVREQGGIGTGWLEYIISGNIVFITDKGWSLFFYTFIQYAFSFFIEGTSLINQFLDLAGTLKQAILKYQQNGSALIKYTINA